MRVAALLVACFTVGCTVVNAYPTRVAEDSEARCADGVDNDYDGQRDCADSSCDAFCREETEARCADGVDNDADGQTDCYDPGCDAFCREDADERCADGVDNDVDGAVDCDDPDCDGRCPEETTGACFDGRDNDGDGRLDHHDARCWAFTEPRLERCSTIDGAVFPLYPETDFLFFQAGWTDRPPAGLDGHSADAVDILGAELDGVEVPLGVAIGNQPIRGAYAWTEAHVEVHLPADPTPHPILEGALTAFLLIPDSRVGVDVTFDHNGGLLVELGPGFARVSTPDQVYVDEQTIPIEVGWHTIDLTIEANADDVPTDALVSVVTPGGVAVRLAVPAPEWEPAEGLRVVYGAAGGPTDDFQFGDAVVTRRDYNPCGRSEGQIVSPGGGGAIGGGAIDARGAVACVATATTPDQRGVTIFRSVDGVELADAWEAQPGFDPREGLVEPDVAWDPVRDEFRVVALDFDDVTLGGVAVGLYASSSCRGTWSHTTLPVRVPNQVSYTITTDRSGAVRHEIFYVDESQRLQRLLSTSGDPSSFELTPLDPPAPAFPPGLELYDEDPARVRFHRFVRVGEDLVALLGPRGDGGAVRLLVRGADGWTEIGSPAIPGSTIPGTFDRWRVTRAGATVVPDEDVMNPDAPAGLLFVYSGLGDSYCQRYLTCFDPGGATALEFVPPGRSGPPEAEMP